MEWARGGKTLNRQSGRKQLELRIGMVEVVHRGHYTCHADLPSSYSPSQLGPLSAGYLNVIGK